MKTYAVTSGKGGVGKTNVSANLGIAFASLGQRTVIIDGDVGLANLDVILGQKAPLTLQNVLSGEVGLSQALCHGPGGIQFVAGGSGLEALVNLNGPQAERFLNEIAALELHTDILIFDTGAGIDNNVLTFLGAADETLVVVTPDPASLADGYATIKALLTRKPDSIIRIISNMVDDEAQGRAVFARLYSVTQQFLNRPLLFGGSIRYDGRAVNWIRKREPFFIADPQSPASRDIQTIATALCGMEPVSAREGFTARLRGLFAGLKAA